MWQWVVFPVACAVFISIGVLLLFFRPISDFVQSQFEWIRETVEAVWDSWRRED